MVLLESQNRLICNSLSLETCGEREREMRSVDVARGRDSFSSWNGGRGNWKRDGAVVVLVDEVVVAGVVVDDDDDADADDDDGNNVERWGALGKRENPSRVPSIQVP